VWPEESSLKERQEIIEDRHFLKNREIIRFNVKPAWFFNSTLVDDTIAQDLYV
jgi:hypothetical protein